MRRPRRRRRIRVDANDAEAVSDALWLGARDFDEILPYAREFDRIVVTSNVADVRGLEDHEHAGIILVFDNESRAEQIVTGLRAIVDAYPSGDALRGYETLDPWLDDER